MKMTAKEKIKRTVLIKHFSDDQEIVNSCLDENCNIDSIWKKNINNLFDTLEEFRAGEEDISKYVSPEYNRNYESKSVAGKVYDGSYVGWTYYYGGGKYGYPEDVPWLNDAYNLSFTEKEVISTIKIWKIIDG